MVVRQEGSNPHALAIRQPLKPGRLEDGSRPPVKRGRLFHRVADRGEFWSHLPEPVAHTLHSHAGCCRQPGPWRFAANRGVDQEPTESLVVRVAAFQCGRTAVVNETA